MGSTCSSGARGRLALAARSALEGAALAVLAGAALARGLDERAARLAWAGLGAAWAASTASVALIVFARGRPFRAFLRAVGAGIALRAAALAALMAAVWKREWAAQAPLLGAYALGVLFLLLLEYRQLIRKDS